MMGQPAANEGGDQVTTEDRKREIFAQPSAAKEVYVPKGHYVNGHIIVRGPDGLWHLFYEPAYPGQPPSSFDHATSEDLLTWTHHGTVLEAGGPGDCDAYEVGDGCIIEHGGRWHLVYHGEAISGCQAAALPWLYPMTYGAGLSYPGDGSPTFIPDRELSGWREEGVMECKDPYIIYQDGTYLHVLRAAGSW